MPPVYIYVLADPRTLQIKYVGSTTNLRRRKTGHWNSPQPGALKKWVTELRSLYLRPIFSIIKETTQKERYHEEGYWISYFATKGQIFNVTSPTTLMTFENWAYVYGPALKSKVVQPTYREMLTIREAAERLHLKPAVFRLFWITPKKLPAFKVGRSWRVWADDVQKVLEQNLHPNPFANLYTRGRAFTPPDIPE